MGYWPRGLGFGGLAYLANCVWRLTLRLDLGEGRNRRPVQVRAVR
jgi:hypothetical protein